MNEGRKKRYILDLSKPRDKKPYSDINFDSFFVINLTGNATVRLENKNNTPYDLNTVLWLKNLDTVEKFFITNEKQEGKTLEILTTKNLDIGTLAQNSMKVIDTVGLQTSDVDFDSLGNLNTNLEGYNNTLINDSFIYNEGNSIDTLITKDIALPENITKDNLFLLMVENPSSTTKLEVNVGVKWVDSDSNTHYPNLLNNNMLINQQDSKAQLIQGAMLSEGCRVKITNETAITAGNSFTGHIKIVQL